MTDGTPSGTAPGAGTATSVVPGSDESSAVASGTSTVRASEHGSHGRPREPSAASGTQAALGTLKPDPPVAAKVAHVSAAKREGRSHRIRGTPCQDAFAVWQAPGGGRAAAAVADGLGSKPLSHLGSEAACRAAVASLALDPVWDEAAVLRAFDAARAAVEAAAAVQAVAASELATTLQVAALDDGVVVAGMVGDGAIVVGGPAPDGADGTVVASGSDGRNAGVAGPGGVPQTVDWDATDWRHGPGRARILLAPADAEYSNEVVPLTYRGWREHFRFERSEGAAWVMLFTDGLTRLLLSRSRDGWGPFAPFFDAFLPKLGATPFDGDVARRLLSAPNIDASWDDDKCLVVMASGGDQA